MTTSSLDSSSVPEQALSRLQIDLPAHRVEQLHELRKLAGLDTLRELFNNSLALMQWVVEQRRAGRQIASIDDAAQTMREIDMPFFANISAAPQGTQEQTPE